MSKFTFYYGCMGSGKSLDLIRTAYNYKERGMGVLVYKPDTDTREGYDDCVIATRVGLRLEAEWLKNDIEHMEEEFDNDIFMYAQEQGFSREIQVILIDEAQFLTKEQVLAMKKYSLRRNIPFIFYGLKVDFQSNLFEGTQALLSWSEKSQELMTMCSCGKPARQNARVVNKKIIREGEQVAIEGETQYIPFCNKCYLTKEEI